MNERLIHEQITFTPLKRISVKGGDVFHILRNNDNSFIGFGEAYFSSIESKFIKAWKKHNKMRMNLVVPLGKVLFVFYCEKNNQFVKLEVGEENYGRITVPPNYWFGFQGISNDKSIILNISDVLHTEDEIDRLDSSEIKFDWY